MVFCAESGLGSSLHNNGHTEYPVEKQQALAECPLEPSEDPLQWQRALKVLFSARMSAMRSSNEALKLGSHTQERGATISCY